MQTMQQYRAKYALSQVQEFLRENSGDKEKLKDFKSRARDLPCMIHMTGLGPAAAFYRSKKNKDGYDFLFKILEQWLTGTGPVTNEKAYENIAVRQPLRGGSELISQITSHDLADYIAAEAEAIIMLEWVKRFADAYIDVK